MPSTTYDDLDVTVEAHVAWIRLDRPAAQHSLTTAMAGELHDAIAWAASDGDIRAIVLGGTEGRFCTGADLRGFTGDASDERRLWGIARRLHAAIRELVAAPKPVVVGIEGVAAGGGLGLALTGDLVYMASDARIEFAYPRIGLSGDGGVSFLLPRLIGLRRARELVLLDEPIGAETALEWGLVTDVVEPADIDNCLASVGGELAAGPTRAYGRLKQLMWDGFGRTLDDQLRAEVEAISRLAHTEDYAAGYEAFGSETSPTFTGR